MENKKELNLELEQESKLITDIIEKSLAGITRREIVELRKICNQDRYKYYNKIKFKYIVFIGLLGLNFKITEEIEETVFFFIHDIIHKISVNGADNKTLQIKLS